MTDDKNLTDDYVASLLAKDAKETSIKYSALGLEGFAPSKPPVSKPKPNTRFLRNIIKDTDNHNAALLAKEAAESRARLQSLASSEHRDQKASRVGGADTRRRQLGDITAILVGRSAKRRRKEDSKRDTKRSRRVNTSSEDEEPQRRSDAHKRRKHDIRDDEIEDGRRSKGHKIKGEDIEENQKARSHRSHHRRHKSPSEDQGKDKGEYRRRHNSRSRSPRDHRSKELRHRHRSPNRERSRSLDAERPYRSRRHRRSTSTENKDSRGEGKPAKKSESKPGHDSDPLEDMIGPLAPRIPEVRSRGRGTISQASGIDSRFSASYDPTVDVQLDPEEDDDWDQALEALRDRQKWKQQGADRLRAAGFTEEEIGKWEKGGEKREEDVKWAKKGEDREWDRGKVIDEEGAVTVEPSWGRLKGT